jgi:hypothetical protein
MRGTILWVQYLGSERRYMYNRVGQKKVPSSLAPPIDINGAGGHLMRLWQSGAKPFEDEGSDVASCQAADATTPGKF